MPTPTDELSAAPVLSAAQMLLPPQKEVARRIRTALRCLMMVIVIEYDDFMSQFSKK